MQHKLSFLFYKTNSLPVFFLVLSILTLPCIIFYQQIMIKIIQSKNRTCNLLSTKFPKRPILTTMTSMPLLLQVQMVPHVNYFSIFGSKCVRELHRGTICINACVISTKISNSGSCYISERWDESSHKFRSNQPITHKMDSVTVR